MIYINNLGKVPLDRGDMFLFADDTLLLFEGNSWEDVYHSTGRGFLSVKRWFDHSRLTVNVNKTKHMAICLRAAGDPLDMQLKLHSCGSVVDTCPCPSVERE